jgi:NAD(P)-dependent dehydrogenase (short-subunit alcohol dehydrogenase family)
MPVDPFKWVKDVNVKGTFLMAQAAGRRMIQRGADYQYRL